MIAACKVLFPGDNTKLKSVEMAWLAVEVVLENDLVLPRNTVVIEPEVFGRAGAITLNAGSSFTVKSPSGEVMFYASGEITLNGEFTAELGSQLFLNAGYVFN